MEKRGTERIEIIKNALTEIKRLKCKIKNQSNFQEPIAIVGMACRLPGGIGSPEGYWAALMEHKDMISPVPDNRWKHYPPEKRKKNPFLQKGGFLKEDIADFDHQLFRLSPKETERTDPHQRLFLKICWEALENSGYAPDQLKGSKTGIYAGISALDHIRKLFGEHQSPEHLEPTDIMGSSFSFLSGRASYFFGFHGPGITTDTACSSSLVAVDQARKGLLSGDCDMALAGGVNLLLSPETTELMASLNVLSPDGKNRSFDATANGTVRGEGCGVIVMKRLSDAQRDGNHIHALIKGSGSNQDGLSSGLTSPYGPAQEKLIQEVWERSGLDIGDIDFIETHGTGTALGDPIEATALGNVLPQNRKRPVYLGAVKTSIGHLEAAAGIAGLIKATLAVEKGYIPANLHFNNPSPYIDWEHLPIEVPKENIPWNKDDGTRKAAVSSFGLSGTNAHAILEEYKPSQAPSLKEASPQVRRNHAEWPFRFSATSPASLKDQLEAFLTHLSSEEDINLGNLAYSQNVSRPYLKQNMVIWAENRDKLIAHLRSALQGRTSSSIRRGKAPKKVIFLFSGGGSQYPGMFKEFYLENHVFKKYMDQCNMAYLKLTGHDLLSIIFSQDQCIHEMRYTQVALFAVEYSLAKMWIEYGVEPRYMLGHSTGEYVAACLAEVFSLEDAIRLITRRGELMYALPKNGSMSAVRTGEEKVRKKLGGFQKVTIAATNTPEQTVISGDREEVLQLSALLEEEGIEVKPIQVTHASHSPLMEPMIPQFEEVSKQIPFSTPKKAFLSNVTGKEAHDEIASYPYWTKHILSPVRFRESISSIDHVSDHVFLEIGPQGILTQMVENIVGEGNVEYLVSNHKDKETAAQIERCIFQLSNFGIDIHWKKYYEHSAYKKIPVPNYQFRKKRFVLEEPTGIGTTAGMDWDEVLAKMDALSLGEEEKKHFPAIIDALKKRARQPRKEEEEEDNTFLTETQSVYTLDSVEKIKDYVRSSLIREWKAEEEDFSNDENLLLNGLDSIVVARLLAQWREDLSIPLKAAVFLKSPTIHQWAEIIHEHLKSEEKIRDDSTPFHTDLSQRYAPFGFSEVQEAYWVGRNPEIEWGGFSCYGYFEIDAPALDTDRFRKALDQLISHHEMLRAIITEEGHQQVLPELSYSLPVYRCSSTPDMEGHLKEIREVMASQTFPFGHTMFDLRLTEMEEGYWRIHFGMDFIIADALSIHLFWSDLYQLYQGTRLPALEVSFRDYIHYLEDRKKGSRYLSDKQYWLERISSLPPAPKLPMRTSSGSTDDTPHCFARREKYFTPEQWQKFVHAAAKQHLTPSAALLTLFSEVLSAWGAGNHFGLILTVFDRDKVHPQINEIMGDFTQLSLLEVHREDRTVTENAQALQWQMQEDIGHATYSAIEVVREIAEGRKSGEFLYPFVFTSAIGVDGNQAGFGSKDLFGEVGYMVSQTPQVWIDSQVFHKNGGTCVSWDAAESIFPEGMLEDMYQKYLGLIHEAINDEGFWQSTLTDLRPEQQQTAHERANQTTVAYENTLLHSPILQAAQKEENRTAIVFEEKNYTYGQLVQQANQVSQCLQEHGMEKGEPVALQMAKSFDMIAAVLGIVQAGGVYVPLSHDNPVNRTLEIMKKSGASKIFTDSLPKLEAPDMALQLTKDDLKGLQGNWKPVTISPEETAYVIYTSGSTGTPKGVVIAHQAARNTIMDVNQRFGITKDDSVLGISSLSFDLSVYDIFGLLAVGGTLVLPTEQERIDPKCWKKLYEKYRISLWNTVPALLELYVDYLINSHGSETNPHLKNIYLSGDWIPLSIYEKVRKVLPNAQLISMGGATEASIWSNYYKVDKIDRTWRSIPYGYPLANQSFYILDEFQRPCPDWVQGKLHISGKGLAKGYLNEPSLSGKAFITHPISGQRLYDTGDYGRYTPGGIIEFLGRKDDQVKINGYRIEIGEVQAAFRKCGHDLDPIILVTGGAMESKKLVAYIKQDPKTFSEENLKQQLRDILPSYFLPEKIIALAAYPQTPNGKVDRKRLLQEAKNHLKETQGTPAQDTSPSDHPVLKVVRQVLDRPTLRENDQFTALGVSSMDIIQLANQLEAHFSDRPPVGDMIRYDSTRDLIAYYEAAGTLFDLSHHEETSINPKFLVYSKEQREYLEKLALVESYEDRIAYKKSHSSQRQDLASHPKIMLEQDIPEEAKDHFFWRKSHRKFQAHTIPLQAFGHYLSLCYQRFIADEKQYHYGSAGETYPVQLYLSVFRDKIEGVEEGTYYLNVKEYQLIRINATAMSSPDKLAFNHPWLNEAAFIIHLVADMEVIYPIYQEHALRFSHIECGLICQLLESQGTRFDIGSCQLGAYDFDQVRSLFDLSTKHVYLHSLAAGAIDHEHERKLMEEVSKTDRVWKKEAPVLRDLVQECENQGINLWADGQRLKFKAPEGAMTPALQAKLKSHKETLIQYLIDREYKDSQKTVNPAFEPFSLTPIQWAFVTGRRADFELGDVGAHYYTEIACPREAAAHFEHALNEVIGYHEALRTIIYEDGTQQVLKDKPYYKVQETFIEKESQIEAIRERWSHHKYALGKWPMFHFQISHFKNEPSRIHLSIDLLVIDAWSGDLMLAEIFKVIAGENPSKPRLTFKNYLEKEKEWHRKNSHFLEKANKYWQDKLAALPPAPALPYTKPLKQISQPRYQRWKFELPEKDIVTLTARSKQYGLTPTAVICTAFMKVLSLWSGHRALTLNLTLFNRLPLEDAMHILGDFTNVALVSFSPKEEPTFMDEVEETQKQLWLAIEHRAQNGLELLRELGKDHPGKAIMPIVFTSLLSSESSDMEKDIFPESLQEVYAISQTPQVAIDHQVYRRGGNYIVNWDVVKEAFNPKEVENMFGLYEKLIKRIIEETHWDTPFSL